MESHLPRRIIPHVKVKKLNFLIHPGRTRDAPQDHGPTEESWKRFKAAQTMFDKYKAKAEFLGEDEVLVAFLHKSGVEFKELLRGKGATERMMADGLRGLKSILGARMAILSSDQNIFETESSAPHNVFHTIERVAKIMYARGYRIDESTKTFAFGERLDTDVLYGAMVLNIAGGFKKHTHILTWLCDVDVHGGMESSELPRFSREVKKNWPRIRLDY